MFMQKFPTQSEKEEALQDWRAPEQVLSLLAVCEIWSLLMLRKEELNPELGPLSWWQTKLFITLLLSKKKSLVWISHYPCKVSVKYTRV